MRSDMSSLTRQLGSVLAPLSKGEERQAIRAAVNQLTAEIGRTAEARYRVLGAEISIDKPARRGAIPKRLIQVLIVDYGNRRNLRFLVDSRGEFTERTVLRHQPPFHRDEIKEARAIAEQDARVAELARLRGSFVSAHAPMMAAEAEGRRVGLSYTLAARGRAPQPLALVVVDLCERRLVAFEPMPSAGNGGGSHGNIR
jgi:hypothetical protein